MTDANRKRILRITPQAQLTTLVQDERLSWPDALWMDRHGNCWIPCAQLNRTPGMPGGQSTGKLPILSTSCRSV